MDQLLCRTKFSNLMLMALKYANHLSIKLMERCLTLKCNLRLLRRIQTLLLLSLYYSIDQMETTLTTISSSSWFLLNKVQQINLNGRTHQLCLLQIWLEMDLLANFILMMDH